MTKPSPRALLALSSLVAFTCLAGAPAVVVADGPATVDEEHLEALKFRNIGPYRGGRVTAVAGDSGDLHTFYMGTTGGGVWKTTDAGLRWANVSDEEFEAGSIGAVAVAPSDAIIKNEYHALSQQINKNLLSSNIK